MLLALKNLLVLEGSKKKFFCCDHLLRFVAATSCCDYLQHFLRHFLLFNLQTQLIELRRLMASDSAASVRMSDRQRLFSRFGRLQLMPKLGMVSITDSAAFSKLLTVTSSN